MTRVYPVPGHYLNSVPAVEHDCEDELCVQSGAFTPDPPPKAAKTKTTEAPDEPGPSDSENRS